MSELIGIARFTFADAAGAAEFRRLSERCMEIVRAKDPGTLQYDTFVSADERHAVVIERYTGSEALIAHAENIGDELMGAVIATAASVEGELLGEPSPELRARFTEGGPVRLLGLHASM